MGFFDNVQSFFGNVGGFFISVKDKVVGTVSGILHDDVRDYAKGVKDIAQGAINRGGDVLVHGEDTIADIGKSFSWPLVLVGGGLAEIKISKIHINE